MNKYQTNTNMNKFETKEITQTFNPLTVGVKVVIGLVLTTLTMFYTISLVGLNPIFTGFFGLFWIIITMVIIQALFRMLSNGSGISLFIYLILCTIEGVLFANIIGFLGYLYIDYYQAGIDPTMFRLAGTYAFYLTLVAVAGGLLVSTKIQPNQRNMAIGKKLMLSMFALMGGIAIFGMIAFIMALFGATGLYQSYINLLYGFGPLSILISVLFVLFAEMQLIVVLIKARSLYEHGASKKLEYAAAALIVMAIVNIYVEIFKLVLKIMGSRR